MALKHKKANRHFIDAEKGTIRKRWKGRIKVALVYPNHYHVGMSNLGFQVAYRLFNRMDQIVCERFFLPGPESPPGAWVKSIESDRRISDFDMIAFSISFENDYPNVLTIIKKAGLPLRASERNIPHPLVIAGGVACFLNPEPIAQFIDCFLIGEAEELVGPFFSKISSLSFDSEKEKEKFLKAVAQHVPGTYVPRFYQPAYKDDGTLGAFEPMDDVPASIQRVFVADISIHDTCSVILTPNTTFSDTHLIEVGRGCPHGCRFCSAGYIYRPPRFRSSSALEESLSAGELHTDKIGLVGAAVSDLPEIDSLCRHILQKNIQISFSSLRADSLSPALLSVLRLSKSKTATIAPDAGSERMRTVINKGMTEEKILSAAQTLVENRILNIKLYFMIGLPTETMEDVDAIIRLCKKIKHRFLTASRVKKHIGTITVSLNSFVPKPFTPFQWFAMDEVTLLKKKIQKVKAGLKKVPNIRVHADVPRWAMIQGLFSLGDRRVGDILLLADRYQGNWAQTLKASPVNTHFYVHRKRDLNERLPWDFIDHGIKKSFLIAEHKRALNEKDSPPCSVGSCRVCGVC